MGKVDYYGKTRIYFLLKVNILYFFQELIRLKKKRQEEISNQKSNPQENKPSPLETKNIQPINRSDNKNINTSLNASPIHSPSKTDSNSSNKPMKFLFKHHSPVTETLAMSSDSDDNDDKEKEKKEKNNENENDDSDSLPSSDYDVPAVVRRNLSIYIYYN